MAAPPRSYSTAHVARRLGISIPTVQRWVDSGQLVAWKTPGGHRRIEADSADRLITARSVLPGIAVMLIDDNAVDRELLTALVLEALPGARLSVHTSAIEALVAIGHDAPAILISDVVMPHMNGLEMLRQLDSHCVVRPRLLVAVTSLAPAQLARLGELPAGVRLVAKPVDPLPFVELLRANA